MARTDMNILLKYTVVLVMILIGIVAFSVYAECPSDACAQSLCGGADGSRTLGRIVSGLTGSLTLAVSVALAVFAMTAFRSPLAASALSRIPTSLMSSALRI